MNQFLLCQKNASQLLDFPHILEIGVIKNPSIRLNGFDPRTDNSFKIYYIQEGKFEWRLNDKKYLLFPGDTLLVLPGVELSNEHNVLEIGTFAWIHLQIGRSENGKIEMGPWSKLTADESKAIGKILTSGYSPAFQNFHEAGTVFRDIQSELFNQEIGYRTKVNLLLDELFILMARQFFRVSNPGRDFPKTFLLLEEELRRNLSHQWTVEEMARKVGLGSTLFNEKVKSFSGFSPLNYLINIRISEAIKLLKKPEISLTDIAYQTGFYSSQHFSTTFKKLTGYSPSQFRKNHLRTK
jgi:AraC-like DNA-binding protein